MFKVCNKDTWTTPMASFWCLYCSLWTYFALCSSVFIVNFEEVNAGWENTFGHLRILDYWNIRCNKELLNNCGVSFPFSDLSNHLFRTGKLIPLLLTMLLQICLQKSSEAGVAGPHTKGYHYTNAPSQKSKPNINASESQLKAQVLQGCSPQDSCKSSTFQCIRTGAKWTKKPYQIILSIFGSIENSFNEYCGWIWSMKQDITSLQHYFHENNHMKSYHKNIWLTISILVKVRYSNWQL